MNRSPVHPVRTHRSWKESPRARRAGRNRGRRSRSGITAAALLFFAGLPSAPPASAETVDLSKTAAGRHAAAYFEAFNSGDEAAVRAFFEAHVSKASLAERPIETRLGVYRQLRADHGRFAPARVLEDAGDGIRIIARDANDEWLEFRFQCEAEPPHAIRSIRIAPSEAPEEAAGPPLTQAGLSAAVAALVDSLARADRFSGTVLLARSGAPFLEKACGLAERRFATPNRTDTKFCLGSINKIFTKVAIGQLAEAGKLRLDDTVDRYLPDYPKEVSGRVTIAMLLEHRSGVGDFFGEKYEAADRSRLRSVSDFIPLFRDTPLWFEPGTDQRYSNGGYILLGAIVEKVSGEDYYDYIRKHVYGPAGMESTDSYASDDPVPNLAMGYSRLDPATGEEKGPLRENVFSRPGRGSPAGGGYSTAEDLVRFVEAVKTGKLLGPKYSTWILGGPRPDLASGEPGDREARQGAGTHVAAATPGAAPPDRRPGMGAGGPGIGIAFGGGAPGMNAVIQVEDDYTVVVLANYDPPSAESLGRKVGALLRRVKD